MKSSTNTFEMSLIIVPFVAAFCLGSTASQETTYIWKPREIVKTIPTQGLAQSVTKANPAPENLKFNLPGDIPLEMVGIGEGTFVMGIPFPESGNVNKNLRGNNSIGHKVTLTNPYWIGKYEVTQEQYESIMGQRSFENSGPRLPADGLTWNEARAFTERLNELFAEELPEGCLFDLPTEAQWEYACRAGTTTTFNNGKSCELEPKTIASFQCMEFSEISLNLNEVGWYNANSGGVIHEVGQKKSNAWGLYDMHGNVCEWCLDCYDRYYGSPEIPDKFKSPSYLLNFIDPAVMNPDTVSVWGERDRGHRIIRGGDYKQGPERETSYYRAHAHPSKGKFGMRVALVKYSLPSIDRNDNTVYGINPTLQQLAINIKIGNDRREQLIEGQKKIEQLQKEYLKHEMKIKRLEMLESALEVARGVTEVAIQTYFDRRNAKKEGGKNAKKGGGGNSASSGFATIKGPSSLSYDSSHHNGQWATYSLYVGGRDVSGSASWSSAGTSIDVSSGGRAMARNPPVNSGQTFRTGIKAEYNGKTYTKSITISKR